MELNKYRNWRLLEQVDKVKIVRAKAAKWTFLTIRNALRDLLVYIQFKKRLLLLVNLQAEACKFTKSNFPSWVFFTFKLCKWYEIAQSITYVKFVMMLAPDVVLTCKFPSDSVGIMSCSSLLLLVFWMLPRKTQDSVSGLF